KAKSVPFIDSIVLLKGGVEIIMSIKNMKKYLHVLLVFLLTFSLGINVSANSVSKDYDTVIKGGTIIDGSGLDRYDADIVIKDGYIAKIGDLSNYTAKEVVNAARLFVTSGFIDIHSHGSTSAIKEAISSLTQCVTTEIKNPDGGGPKDVKQRFELENDRLGINI